MVFYDVKNENEMEATANKIVAKLLRFPTL